jgi:hypothetical protein
MGRKELRGLLCRRPPFGPDLHQHSSSGIDIKEDKENILVDGLVLAFPLEPPMRARLWESVGPSSLAVMPLSTSADLSFENSSITVRVSYFSDSTMA